MKQTDLNALLGEFATYGVPIVYYSYPERMAPELPYAVYYFPNGRPEPADDTAHACITAINIELYTREKDILLEHTVEQIMNRHGLIPVKTETFLESEHMFEVLYEMEEIWEESDMA